MFTEDEKKKLQEHYKRLQEKAMSEKRCITCIHRVPGLPFDLYPPRCDLRGEATHTCPQYEISEEWKEDWKYE